MLLKKVLEAINLRINTSTGLSQPGIKNPDDREAACEIFLRLYAHGVSLPYKEIESWACDNGWSYRDAAELAGLAQQIGFGEEPAISNGPWWQKNIIEILASKIAPGSRLNHLTGRNCQDCLMRLEDDTGNEECLMEVIRSQWAEPFGDTRYCEHPDTRQLVNLVNAGAEKTDESMVVRVATDCAS